MMGKGPGIAADMVFLDLEDAVAPKEKEASRAKIAHAIKTQDWGDKVMCVRVNDWSTKWTAYDIMEVVGGAGARLDEIMLPKVESAAQIVATDLLLRQVEIANGLPVGHIGIEAQIETARGLINVEEICAASPRIETFNAGPPVARKTDPSHGLRVGLQVFHNKFGEGKVLTLEGEGADARAQISFPRHGTKWLALSVAKLTPVE